MTDVLKLRLIKLNYSCLAILILLKISYSSALISEVTRRRSTTCTFRTSIVAQNIPLMPPLPMYVRYKTAVLSRRDGDDDEDDEDDDGEILNINLSEQDWRAFRAKLVMQEAFSSGTEEKKTRTTQTVDDGDVDGIGALFSSEALSTEEQAKTLLQGMTPLDCSQWAYDSGKVIEQGAVILGGVEQDYGFGLRQQYFHKVAILVLGHEEAKFTKGIILNRPTDLTLDDNINPGIKWRVWFGGDVEGFQSSNPEIICIHSLKNDQAIRLSTAVMKDIRWTSFDSAKRLVKVGAAKPTDFWVFSGYAGWGPGQLMGELERKSWYMVATDSQTLLKEMARLGAGSDPRDAGLETWTLLMNMIGRENIARKNLGNFDDLMLKEWARKNLLSKAAGGDATSLAKRRTFTATSSNTPLKVGSMLRASSRERSPFLLDDQVLHKSIILVITSDTNICIGVILSRPATKALELQIAQKKGKSMTTQIPIRFGGQYALKGSDPILWLHCNSRLKTAKLGTPLGTTNGPWKCQSSDVITAVGQGLATPKDFMAVSGVSVWAKGLGEIDSTTMSEKFELVPDDYACKIFDDLLKQELLSVSNLDMNLQIAENAWKKAVSEGTGDDGNEKDSNNPRRKYTPISGLGEGFDEEDDSLVFRSNVKVSTLCDDALRNWVATFLLNTPFSS